MGFGRQAGFRPGRAFLAAVLSGAAASGPWLARTLSAHEAITTELTWTRNVSRILYSRCATCHRDGGPAPMPLTSYAEVRPWAKAIKHEVLTRRMPPWGAVKGFGAFRNDASLSLPEIAVISSWVEGGAPEGDAAFLEAFHHHPQDESKDTPEGERMTVSGTVDLDREVVVTGVSPERLRGAGWLQLTAHLPDGSVEHMIWLREPRPVIELDYWFLRQVRLPRGTRLVCKPDSATIDLRLRDSSSAGP